jgi:ATP-dependent exoDNAse (exonuclease V) alpha subunit
MLVEKIKSRGDGRQLGAYLLSDRKNDEAEVIETRGFEPGDLADALDLAEIEARARTRGEKVFAFAAIVPEDGETLTREQITEAADEAERELGYEGLDRVIVRHLKADRRETEGDHYHVVWNRFDRETGKLRSDSHSGRKMRAAMDRIEERFGLRMRDDHPAHDKARTSDDEARQDDRSAKKKPERSAEITGLWNTTDSGKAFRAALEEAGYTLAYGRQRTYCVVDENGEVHSLARQIKDANAADVKARLADLDPASIPEADAVRAAIRQAQKERAAEAGQPAGPRERANRAERQKQAQADAAQILSDQDEGRADAAGHVPTPRERSEAEQRESAGLAAVLLERVTFTRSTFTRADLEREAAKMTGHTGREAWMSMEGGLAALDDQQRASAERSYEKWAEENPRPAAKYGLEDYVSYAQEREAERQGDRDPESIKKRADAREAFRFVMQSLDQSGEIVSVGPDPRNESRERFTSRAMLQTELAMEAAAATLAGRDGHGVKAKTREAVRKQTEKDQGYELSGEQREALRHITGKEDLSLIVGYAGAGKSTTLNAARGAYEAEGFRVRGAALSGIAAQGLEDSAGIKSTTLHRLLHRLDGQADREQTAGAKIEAMRAKIGKIKGRSEKAQKYRDDLTRKMDDMREDLEAGRLTQRDVIVIDEAAMIGSRDMSRLLAHAVAAGAKVVLVGDHEQTQAIEAGAAFRALSERHPPAVMRDVRRQTEDWQKEATKGFPEGRVKEALDAYRDHGMIHEATSRDDAKAELIEAWARAQRDKPERSAAIFTHLNADVQELNQLGRETFRKMGRLGEDHELTLKDGSITLAEGDRLMFRKNDGQLAVKNGSLATVRKIDGDEITVALDTAGGRAGQGRELKFSTADYQEFSHGYAATVHKTQGVTVDRAFVLATPGMDKHTGYVAMSRHRERVDLFHAREDFKDHDALTRRMARSGAKDSVLDYMQKAEHGHGFVGTLRAAVAGVWGKIAAIFGRPDRHPAEAAQQAREQAARDGRRPGETFIDAVRALADKEREEEGAGEENNRAHSPAGR